MGLESSITMFIVLLFLNSGARNVSLAAISDDEDENSILNGVPEGSWVSEVFVGQNLHLSPRHLALGVSFYVTKIHNVLTYLNNIFF